MQFSLFMPRAVEPMIEIDQNKKSNSVAQFPAQHVLSTRIGRPVKMIVRICARK